MYKSDARDQHRFIRSKLVRGRRGLLPTLIAIAIPQDEQSAMKQTKQWFERNCSRVLPRSKHQASSTSRHPDVPDAQPTTTATDVTSLSRPLPVSPAQGTSRLDVIVNQPSTVPGPTGIGEHMHVGHASCIDCHQPGSQIIILRFSTGHQAILHHIQ
jgi:hypothetical protein